MLNIINADAKRWICSRRFFINIVAIFFVNCLVLSQNVMKELLATNIVYDVDICMEDPFFTMNFILSSMVFGTAYFKDNELFYVCIYGLIYRAFLMDIKSAFVFAVG